ncbi:MAG TPA: hypothetical protein VE643_03890 [Nitrososphaeraceae archaeon]|jgi:hypothetical protein|nr:hypothetical protein [Nitrososphaeraceae archaeon]
MITDEIDINASIEETISLAYPFLSKIRSTVGTTNTKKADSTKIIIHIIVTKPKRPVNFIP